VRGPRPTLTALLAAACVAWTAAPAVAQQARPSALSIDSAASIDRSIDEAGNVTMGVLLDAVASVEFGPGWQGIVRPFAQRSSGSAWNRQVWVAAVRYERPGPVGLRIDGGLIPSPVGLANLSLRPHLNPTIGYPSSLFQALPAFEAQAPRTTLLGALYPYGVSVTVSGLRWDGRAAVIDTSPLRPRRVFAPANPPRFVNVVLGGGVTPVVGLRVGGSITRGGWLRAGERPEIAEGRDATVVTAETEFSIRHTRLLGEWVQDRIETGRGTVVASGWYLQGQQTLSPRWFAAWRVERLSAPALVGPRQDFTGVETAAGYRVTSEVTLRAGHRARRRFGSVDFDNQATVSVVWWRRWL
jgi:hypothetical protein